MCHILDVYCTLKMLPACLCLPACAFLPALACLCFPACACLLVPLDCLRPTTCAVVPGYPTTACARLPMLDFSLCLPACLPACVMRSESHASAVSVIHDTAQGLEPLLATVDTSSGSLLPVMGWLKMDERCMQEIQGGVQAISRKAGELVQLSGAIEKLPSAGPGGAGGDDSRTGSSGSSSSSSSSRQQDSRFNTLQRTVDRMNAKGAGLRSSYQHLSQTGGTNDTQEGCRG